jgi:hypothetical protein
MRCWTSGIRSPASEYSIARGEFVFDLVLVLEEKAEDDDEYPESLGRRAA